MRTTTGRAAAAHHDPEALDLRAVCARYSVGRSFLYNEIAAGRLRTTTLGRRTLVDVRDARAWWESHRAASARAVRLRLLVITWDNNFMSTNSTDSVEHRSITLPVAFGGDSWDNFLRAPISTAAVKRHFSGDRKMETNFEPLLKPTEVAKALRMTTGSLWQDRTRESPAIPFIRLPTGSIRYRASTIQRLLREGSVGEPQ